MATDVVVSKTTIAMSSGRCVPHFSDCYHYSSQIDDTAPLRLLPLLLSDCYHYSSQIDDTAGFPSTDFEVVSGSLEASFAQILPGNVNILLSTISTTRTPPPQHLTF